MLYGYVKGEISYFKEGHFKLLRLGSQKTQDLKGRYSKCVKYHLVFSLICLLSIFKLDCLSFKIYLYLKYILGQVPCQIYVLPIYSLTLWLFFFQSSDIKEYILYDSVLWSSKSRQNLPIVIEVRLVLTF